MAILKYILSYDFYSTCYIMTTTDNYTIIIKLYRSRTFLVISNHICLTISAELRSYNIILH